LTPDTAFAAAPGQALRLFDGIEKRDAEAFEAALADQRAGHPVSPETEAAATRHMLRIQPLDGERWLKLWALLRDSDEAFADRATMGAILRAALADPYRPAAWRAAVARVLLSTGENPRTDAGGGALGLVLADEPDESVLASLLADCAAPHRFRVALSLLVARQTSPVLAFHAARGLFDAGRHDDAITVLRRLDGQEFVHPYTARLLIDVLANAGRIEEARRAVDHHFAHGPSTIWGQPDMQPRRLAARDRGVPPILIATQPKSGSVFILNTLCQGLDCPSTLAVPLEHLDLFGPAPARLDEVAGGGVVCVDHLFANAETLDALRASGISRVGVHLRDPRAATLSWCHNLVDAAYVSIPRRERIRRRITRSPTSFEADYLEWLPRWCRFQEDWLTVVEVGVPGLQILLTDFSDLADEAVFFAKLLDFFGCESRHFATDVLGQSREVRAGHFRKGLAREWETVLSAETQEYQRRIIAGFDRVARYVADLDRRS
jgi:hypothetical protein